MTTTNEVIIGEQIRKHSYVAVRRPNHTEFY